MVVSRGIVALMGATALSALALAPTIAATTRGATTRPVAAASLSAPGSLGSFTPAANPKLAASFARSGLSFGDSGSFRFTPAASPGSRRAVTVAVRARATTKAEAERSAGTNPTIAPTAYNLGVSVGWKRFALSGDIAKVDTGLTPGSREAVDLGLSYSGKSWTTKLQLGADRATGNQPSLLGNDEAVSVDLGGSYALTRNLAVTGGLRYRMQRDRLGPIEDNRRDSQAVYVGTAFRF